MKLLPREGYKAMPWRNGGGTTMEILVAGDDPGQFDFRVSIATVAADGPFSRFPGYQRHIMLIAGNGMVHTSSPLTCVPAGIGRPASS